MSEIRIMTSNPLLMLIAVLISETGEDHMLSHDLVAKLQQVDPEAWGDLNIRTLAAMLRPMGVRPVNNHSRGGLRGYYLRDVAPAAWDKVQQQRAERKATAEAALLAQHEEVLNRYVDRLRADPPQGDASREMLSEVLQDDSMSAADPTPVPVGRSLPAPDPCGVYAYEDADGRLLYIGITKNDEHRDEQHMATQPWARFVEQRTEVATFAYRTSALAEEDRLIRTLRPIFNRTRAGWFTDAAAYLVEHGAVDLLTIRGLAERVGADQAIRELVAVGAVDLLELRDSIPQAAEVTT